MHEEEPFARAILASPRDDAPRLIYADWLEERGDLDRANFLRLGITARRRPPDEAPEIDEELAEDEVLEEHDPAELHRILARIDPDWLALISRTPRFAVIWPPEDLDELASGAQPGDRLDQIRLRWPARSGSDVSSSVALGDQVYAIAEGKGTWRLAGRMLHHRRLYLAPEPGPPPAGRDPVRAALIGIQGSTIRADRWLPGEMPSWFSFRTHEGTRWWAPTGRGAGYLRRNAIVELAPSTAAVLDRLLLGWISPGGD
jgi:uncharacterized protein (TIGR02996 family)